MPVSHNLGADDARKAIDACLLELTARGKVATIAVGDSHGELIALWRMDGASLPTIAIAANKVYTAARVREPSGNLGRAALAEGWDVHYHGDARYVGWEGGMPVIHNSQCLGAVAVSGLSGAEDAEIATLGVNAILAAKD
jgi:glc operon protein GlcG